MIVYFFPEFQDDDLADTVSLTVSGLNSEFMSVYETSIQFSPFENQQAGEYQVSLQITDNDSNGSGSVQTASGNFKVTIITKEVDCS